MIKEGLYRHYKGNVYKVIGTAVHSETLEEMVIYHPLDKEQLWVRPAGMFFEKVQHQGKEMLRFEPITGNE